MVRYSHQQIVFHFAQELNRRHGTWPQHFPVRWGNSRRRAETTSYRYDDMRQLLDLPADARRFHALSGWGAASPLPAAKLLSPTGWYTSGPCR
jgi:hypothetical protein